MSNPSDDCIKPLVVRPRVARQMYGNCSLDTIYDKIKSGEVESRFLWRTPLNCGRLHRG